MEMDGWESGADDERMVDLLGRKQGWEIGRRRQPELR